MENFKKFYPHAFKSTEVKDFIIALIVYLVIDAVCGVVIGLLAKIPLIGFIFSLIGSLVGIYALIGILLSIFVFTQIIQ